MFQLFGKGRNTRQIAFDLNLSLKTIQSFAARIKEKFGLESMNELLLEAIRHESVELKPADSPNTAEND